MKKAVIDLGFGDSGKGTFTAYLCSISNDPMVIRFSGGHQAGHTVVHNGVRHVHSSFGSGTLQGVPTYWSKNCTFSPIAFLNERYALKQKRIDPPIVLVNGKCPVTTFLDAMHNKKVNDENGHGSCGVGFGATLEREENHYSLLVEDLQHPSVLKIKLEMIEKYYGLSFPTQTEFFLDDCRNVLSHITIIDELVHYSGDIIYESSQGLLLDKDIGFFPHVTRGNVGSNMIDDSIDEVFYVTRAYQTRHGNGPMTNEDLPHNIKDNPNETNVTNYQGEFRKTLLDLDLLLYSLSKDANRAPKASLVITCLDHVEDEWRFTYKGQVDTSLNEDEFINKISLALHGFINSKIYVSHSDEFKNIKVWKK